MSGSDVRARGAASALSGGGKQTPDQTIRERTLHMGDKPGTAASVGLDWPLVGREAELQAFAGLVIHDRRSLVLAGPAGVGKTRLAAELSERCRRAGLGALCLTGTTSAASIPFGALASLLPPVERELAGRVDAIADLLRRTVVALVNTAAPRRLCLCVDDAHLLDDASATLVHQLAATTAASVVATIRSGEPAPDVVTALWRDNLAERREVKPLTAHQIGELLSAALSRPIDPGAVAELVERSNGNVMFLRELVIGALDSGTLFIDDGIWRLKGTLALSDRLSELVSARVRVLTVDELALLELVAVGEPLSADVLTALGNPLVAERLERKKLLASHIEGDHLAIRFAHPVYGEVVRNQIPALRRRDLARSLADAVEQAGISRREDLLRVAVWRLDGGGGTPDQMLAAATEARWRYDFALAERLVRVAQSGGAGFEADLLSAQLASLQGRTQEAEREFAALADRVGDDDQRGAVAIARLDNLAFYLGRSADAIEIAEEAEARLNDASWRDQIRARRSALVFQADGPRAGADVASPLLEQADGRALVWAAQVAAFTFGRLGRIDAGLDATVRGHSAHLGIEEPMNWYPWTHLFFRCQLLAWSGRFEDAHSLATAQYEQALTEHSAEARAWFAWHYASVVAERGNVESATRHGREAVALFRELGRPQFMAFALTYLATALALSGQPNEAADTLRTLDELGISHSFMGVDPIQARAWAAAAAGDLPKGRQLLEEAAATGEDIGDYVGRAAALHGLARLGRARDVNAALNLEADRIEGELVRARAAHTRALARNDADELSNVSGAFEVMGANLLAAEAAADAAIALRKSGDRRSVTAAERHARVLADRCKGAATPALSRIKVPVILSPAERDTALLAAAGRSNKEIAQELYLSVRTVEGRLQRAYSRLGVSNRQELAEALEMLGPAGQLRDG